MQGFLNPGVGTCVHMLNTAARHGDANLATDVFRVLSEREVAFDRHDYELLIEAYLNAGDLKAALSILPIMQSARRKIDHGSTRILFKYLRGSPERPAEAFQILRELQVSGNIVPTEAMNCVIESSFGVGNFEQGIEQYKALHEICKAGPNTDTFNAIFKGCKEHKRKDIAMFLVAEMLQMKVSPDPLTYDRLILVCLVVDGDCRDAIKYFDEMFARKWQTRFGTWLNLVNRMIDLQDGRLLDILAKGFEFGFLLPRDVRLRLSPGMLAEVEALYATKPVQEGSFRRSASYSYSKYATAQVQGSGGE
jgi:hypothetical protein